jgi:hypothetical protein
MPRPRHDGNGKAAAPALERGSDLFAQREVCPYNADEQQFSRYIQGRLEKLLKGDLNCLPLLRRYHQEAGRLGAPLPDSGLDECSLRLTIVEDVLTRVLLFLQTGMPGGPVCQETVDGHLVERQLHTTRFPHIVIERIDRYESASGKPLETEWVIQRMQNQHVDTRINRLLDIANLGLEFFRAAR